MNGLSNVVCTLYVGKCECVMGGHDCTLTITFVFDNG